jgi:hypothetical protein
VVEKAVQEFRGESESHEWVEAGQIASEALDLDPGEIDALCESLKEKFRG